MPTRNSKKEMDKIKEDLEAKSKEFKISKTKLDTDYYKTLWKDSGLKNPLEVVKDFIKEKGLKLYGGQALHEHLAPFNEGFYESYEFPDYDVFSPDAWNHAKELADKLQKLGYNFVEAKSSILNDDHHQTYKVGVDLLYILDLTQIGCPRTDMLDGKCKKCGETKDNKCISIFNNIPVVNMLTYNPKKKSKQEITTVTYDYTKNEAVYPTKLFLCSPEYLKISLYREITEPLGNYDRLPKVGSRLHTLEKYFKYDHKQCKPEEYKKEIDANFKPVLKFIGEYIVDSDLINYGASAYNFLVKNVKNLNYGSVDVADYQVYTYNAEWHVQNLLKLLSNKFRKMTFNRQEKIYYWKEQDVNNIAINVSYGDLKYNTILLITEYNNCMPYIQYNRVRYATIDRLKHILHRAVVLRQVTDLVEENPSNYECMLSSLLKAEQSNKNSKKFRQFVATCSGAEVSKIHTNLRKQWKDKSKVLKKTKFLLDKPKKGFITKISPMPHKTLKLPYRPSENKIKKYIKSKSKK